MGYDAIVMAPGVHARPVARPEGREDPLLCSFFSGYGAIADKLNEIAAQKQ